MPDNSYMSMEQENGQPTSDKEGIIILREILIAKGIRRVVLSPGSRNAPLTVAFAREKRLEHYVILDERSAAFFALGLAQQSGEAVVLVCTSGTALLNYGPAVAEAYYQRLPLLVISADRPEEWIDQDDSQTIRQEGIFRNIVKASWQLPVEIRQEEERWYVNRLVNDAVDCAWKGRRGPVHINIPLHEPLYGLRAWPAMKPRVVEYAGSGGMEPEVLATLAGRMDAAGRVMILAGMHVPDAGLREAVRKLALLKNVVVLSETPANLGFGRHIATIDRVLAGIQEEELAEYAPDLLISYGGPMISRRIKAFLRDHRPQWHWSIDPGEHPADTFQALTTHIGMEAGKFLPLLAGVAKGCPSDYAARWQEKKESTTRRHEHFASQAEWSDWKAFECLLPALPAGCALQLSNSTPVRYGQLFEYPQVDRTDSNRGTSGIDGATSTAVGAACLHPGMTVLVTGDMGFLYDSNALWNPYVNSRLRIVVMKNGGGGIFRFIAGPSGLEELETCFETAQEVNVQGFAELHRFRYFRAGSAAELKEVLPLFFREASSPAVLEIETPRLRNAEVLKSYFRALSGENR